MKENKSSISLDSIDKKIIYLLKDNARNSVSKIADLVNLSVPATSDRIKKLEESNIIKGYKAIIDSRKIGIDLRAFITIISDSSSNYEKIINFVNETHEVVECFATTGRGSHILIVETQNTDSLEKLLRIIQSWTNVIRTETQIILSENKIFTQINNK